MPMENEILKVHGFLREMYDDAYFPRVCIDKVKAVLVHLCIAIEKGPPADLEALQLRLARSKPPLGS